MTGWPSPEEALERAAVVPFTMSSSLLARKLGTELEWYSEPLSINGHAVLAASVEGPKARLLAAVRVKPWNGVGEAARREWEAVWTRWSSALERLRGLGAKPVEAGSDWYAVGLEADVADVYRVAEFLAAARGLACIRGYTGRSDTLMDYDVPGPSIQSAELLQNFLGMYTLYLVTGLTELGDDESEAWEFVRYLAENSLYLGLEADHFAMREYIGEEPRADAVEDAVTLSRLYELFKETFGEAGGEPVNIESLRRALQAYKELGAARVCRVKVVDRDGVARTRDALFFDLRHELSLTPALSVLRSGPPAPDYTGVACALLPYLTGVRHEAWQHAPGALARCREACARTGICARAREAEARSPAWPDENPELPAPCHGVRRVLGCGYPT